MLCQQALHQLIYEKYITLLNIIWHQPSQPWHSAWCQSPSGRSPQGTPCVWHQEQSDRPGPSWAHPHSHCYLWVHLDYVNTVTVNITRCIHDTHTWSVLSSLDLSWVHTIFISSWATCKQLFLYSEVIRSNQWFQATKNSVWFMVHQKNQTTPSAACITCRRGGVGKARETVLFISPIKLCSLYQGMKGRVKEKRERACFPFRVDMTLPTTCWWILCQGSFWWCSASAVCQWDPQKCWNHTHIYIIL